jgi:hypothetical protein
VTVYIKLNQYIYRSIFYNKCPGCCGSDCMVVGFTTTYAISAYHHWSCELESHSVSYNNKTDSNVIGHLL